MKIDLHLLINSMLINSISKSDIYDILNYYEYLTGYKLSEEDEEELYNYLNVLSGFHNPYLYIDSNGIHMKEVELHK